MLIGQKHPKWLVIKWGRTNDFTKKWGSVNEINHFWGECNPKVIFLARVDIKLVHFGGSVVPFHENLGGGKTFHQKSSRMGGGRYFFQKK